MTTGVRQSSAVEVVPQPPTDLTRWAEDIIDYLTRTLTDKQRQIDALEARIAQNELDIAALMP